MNHRAFSKIWIIVILAIFIAGGIFTWQYLRVPKEEAKAPEEETKAPEEKIIEKEIKVSKGAGAPEEMAYTAKMKIGIKEGKEDEWNTLTIYEFDGYKVGFSIDYPPDYEISYGAVGDVPACTKWPVVTFFSPEKREIPVYGKKDMMRVEIGSCVRLGWAPTFQEFLRVEESGRFKKESIIIDGKLGRKLVEEVSRVVPVPEYKELLEFVGINRDEEAAYMIRADIDFEGRNIYLPIFEQMLSSVKFVTPGTFEIIIDSETYNYLKPEIDRYIEDVKKDINYDVSLEVVSPSATPTQIKKKIKEVNFKTDLKWVLLVGEIPYIYYYPGTVSQKMISDSYYYDVFDKCPYSEKKLAYPRSNPYCDPGLANAPFRIFRIKSPIRGEEGYKLLKDYFNKNHEYRIHQGNLIEKALIYPPLVNDIMEESVRKQTIEHGVDQVNNFLHEKLKMYDEKDIKVIEWEETLLNPSPDEEYLSELGKNNEYIHVNAHGCAFSHDFNIDKERINPNTFYIELASCDVGNFSEEYLAGYYLTKGDTMLVSAPTDTLFAPTLTIRNTILWGLVNGETIGESTMLISTDPSTHYFGDPTLRMRYSKTLTSNAEIQVDKKAINFGMVEACEDDSLNQECLNEESKKIVKLFITNKGSEELGFVIQQIPNFSSRVLDKIKYSAFYQLPYAIKIINTFCSDGECRPGFFEIPPGEIREVPIELTGIRTGGFSGNLLIFSNDYDNPILKLPFSMRITEKEELPEDEKHLLEEKPANP